jgi:hypothetical protein
MTQIHAIGAASRPSQNNQRTTVGAMNRLLLVASVPGFRHDARMQDQLAAVTVSAQINPALGIRPGNHEKGDKSVCRFLFHTPLFILHPQIDILPCSANRHQCARRKHDETGPGTGFLNPLAQPRDWAPDKHQVTDEPPHGGPAWS